MVHKFKETENVCIKIMENRRVLTQDAEVDILGDGYFNINTKSLQVTNITVSYVHKTLRLIKLSPYKIQFLQQLPEDYQDKKIEFLQINDSNQLDNCIERNGKCDK